MKNAAYRTCLTLVISSKSSAVCLFYVLYCIRQWKFPVFLFFDAAHRLFPTALAAMHRGPICGIRSRSLPIPIPNVVVRLKDTKSDSLLWTYYTNSTGQVFNSPFFVILCTRWKISFEVSLPFFLVNTVVHHFVILWRF